MHTTGEQRTTCLRRDVKLMHETVKWVGMRDAGMKVISISYVLGKNEYFKQSRQIWKLSTVLVL